jgi:hypothetical protein
MTRDFDFDRDWAGLVARFGGADGLAQSARQTKAFMRRREIANAVDLLQLVLAYCLGESGLRLTAGWAATIGLANFSNVALLKRLQQCGDWFSFLVGQLLATRAPVASKGRLIRIIDATAVPKAGAPAKRGNGIWRIHSAFDLPSERFSAFELTDESGAERLDRIPVIKGEIRLADRVHLQTEPMATVIEAGGDVVIRAGWKSARWLEADRTLFDLPGELAKATHKVLIDRPIWLDRGEKQPALALRLVAVRKSPQAAEAARRAARRQAQRGGSQISDTTLVCADWLILITSLKPDEFSAEDVAELYRLRWRIELAFKRLKSLIGLKGPPGTDPRSARTYILAHLLMLLIVEPVIDELDLSPHWDQDGDSQDQHSGA